MAPSPSVRCRSVEDRYNPIEKIIYYQLGEKQVPIRMIQYGERTDIICINLHDNEFTSVEAARNVLLRTGGTLIKIDNSEQRLIRFRFRGKNYSFDPNRMFSGIGLEKSLEENSQFDSLALKEIEGLAGRVLGLLDSARCIIALHNNTEGAYSVRSYLKGGDLENDALRVAHYPKEDPDDLFFTTNEQLYNRISKFGYNTILQDNHKATRDGSLSVWCGENNRCYVNIETEHGNTGKYITMLEKLLVALDINN